MVQISSDRRAMPGFDTRLPAAVRRAGANVGSFVKETQGVSGGVFFYLEWTVAEGTHVQVTLTFPAHVTPEGRRRGRFTARVIRVDRSQPSSPIGVDAVIRESVPELRRQFKSDQGAAG
jgi:hypothetical protein